MKPALLTMLLILSGCGGLDSFGPKGASLCTMDTTWTTVDRYELGNGNSWASGMGEDPEGNLYVIGAAEPSTVNTNRSLITRKSTDGGATWSTIDEYQFTDNLRTQGQGIYFDSTGNRFESVGITEDGTLTYKWLIRRSTDGGESYNESTFQLASGKNTVPVVPGAFFIAANGTIFASAQAIDSSSKEHGLIRRSEDGGITFSTVKDYQYVSGKASRFDHLTADSAGAVYATGYGTDSSDKQRGIILKSTDNGENWELFLDYQLTSGESSAFSSLAFDSAGNFYVVGNTIASGGVGLLTILKSSDAGVTWSVLDRYELEDGFSTGGRYLRFDASGNIFVNASANLSGSTRHWIIRRGSSDGTTWTTSDEVSPSSSGQLAGSYDIFKDRNGNLFALGYVTEDDGYNTWFVRKLACVAPTQAGTTIPVLPISDIVVWVWKKLFD